MGTARFSPTSFRTYMMVYRQRDKAYTTLEGLHRLTQLVISVGIGIVETKILQRREVLYDPLALAHLG